MSLKDVLPAQFRARHKRRAVDQMSLTALALELFSKVQELTNQIEVAGLFSAIDTGSAADLIDTLTDLQTLFPVLSADCMTLAATLQERDPVPSLPDEFKRALAKRRKSDDTSAGGLLSRISETLRAINTRLAELVASELWEPPTREPAATAWRQAIGLMPRCSELVQAACQRWQHFQAQCRKARQQEEPEL